jgi:hypothetical protein
MFLLLSTGRRLETDRPRFSRTRRNEREPTFEGTGISVPSSELVFGGLGFNQIAANRDLTGELVWCPKVVPSREILFFLIPSIWQKFRE